MVFGPTSIPKSEASAPAAAPAAEPTVTDEDLMEAVADELVGAMHGKDRKAVSTALRAFLAAARAADAKESAD